MRGNPTSTTIKQLRDEAGILQKAAVKAAQAVQPSMRISLFSEIENGNANFTPQVLEILAVLYDAPPERLRSAPEYAYTFLEGKHPAEPERRDKHKITASVRCRLDGEKKGLFIAACAASGTTVQETIEGFVDAIIEEYTLGSMEDTA